MKVGDLIRIKDPFDHEVGAYHTHLFDEIMLVTDIVDELVLDDDDCQRVAIDALVECVGESGVNRFPMEDMEVVPEILEQEIMELAMALADH